GQPARRFPRADGTARRGRAILLGHGGDFRHADGGNRPGERPFLEAAYHRRPERHPRQIHAQYTRCHHGPDRMSAATRGSRQCTLGARTRHLAARRHRCGLTPLLQLLRRRVVTVAMIVWRAMAGNPVRFVLSRWPWRSLAYVVSGVAVISIAWLAIMPLLLLVGIPIGALERHRLGFMEPLAVPDPHAPAPPSGWAWVRRRVTEAATWRELG